MLVLNKVGCLLRGCLVVSWRRSKVKLGGTQGSMGGGGGREGGGRPAARSGDR